MKPRSVVTRGLRCRSRAGPRSLRSREGTFRPQVDRVAKSDSNPSVERRPAPGQCGQFDLCPDGIPRASTAAKFDLRTAADLVHRPRARGARARDFDGLRSSSRGVTCLEINSDATRIDATSDHRSIATVSLPLTAGVDAFITIFQVA